MTKQEKIKAKGAYHHGDLKQNLIRAARHLVEETGNFDFSMSEACRRAGVSSAAPYKHFSDKEDLLTYVAEEGLLEMTQKMKAASDAHPLGSEDAIAAMGHAYIDFARTHKGLFRVMFGGAVQSEDCCNRLHTVGEVECKPLVARQVFAALNGENVPPDIILERVYQLWTSVHGLAFLFVEDILDEEELPRALDTMMLSTARLIVQPGN